MAFNYTRSMKLAQKESGKHVYLLNAVPFSIISGYNVFIRPISVADVKYILGNYDWTSYIGHEVTAQAVSLILGIDVPFNRGNAPKDPEAIYIIAGYTGPRLEEGQVLTEVSEDQISFAIMKLSQE